MSKLRAVCISISLDGFAAGPDQSLENPFGRGAMSLPQWMLETQAGHQMMGKDGGSTGVDSDLVRDGLDNEIFGAHIIGRNMFDPKRGPWDESWDGWWGDNPPFQHPVFVLTHYDRKPIVKEGGTTFHFVTDGIESALGQAQEAAGDRDIRLGGGATTIRQYIQAGLLDELHIVSVPFLIGSGERILDAETTAVLKDYTVEFTPSETVTHIRFAKP